MRTRDLLNALLVRLVPRALRGLQITLSDSLDKLSWFFCARVKTSSVVLSVLIAPGSAVLTWASYVGLVLHCEVFLGLPGFKAACIGSLREARNPGVREGSYTEVRHVFVAR